MKFRTKDVRAAAFGMAAAFGIAACGGPLKYEVPSTSIAPGADADIVADVRADQAQTLLEIEFKNLPPPERVSAGATSFVAWYRKSSGSVWARVGAFKYEEGSREAKLSGSVPEVAFDLTVSVEKADAPASPSAEIVLSQRVEE